MISTTQNYTKIVSYRKEFYDQIIENLKDPEICGIDESFTSSAITDEGLSLLFKYHDGQFKIVSQITNSYRELIFITYEIVDDLNNYPHKKLIEVKSINVLYRNNNFFINGQSGNDTSNVATAYIEYINEYLMSEKNNPENQEQ